MKKGMRKELQIGLLLVGTYFVLSRFFPIPGYILGVLLGLGLAFEIVGILPDSVYQRIKRWKKQIVLPRQQETK